MTFFTKLLSFGKSNRKSTPELRRIAIKDASGGLKSLTGRFGVGFVDVEWEDSENLTFGLEETELVGNEIPFVLARIYYPNRIQSRNDSETHEDDSQNGTWLPSSHYFPGYGYYLRIPTLVSSGIGRLLAANVRIWAREGVPLASIAETQSETFPVMIFSHGIAGIRTTYSSICCEMASRGVVVIALEHRDGSASMTIDRKGKVYPYRTGPSGINSPIIDYEYRAAQLKHRLKEFKSTVKFMNSLNEAGDFASIISTDQNLPDVLKQFKGRLLTSRIILMGHSFGGATCLAASQQMQNVTCCIAIDPWMFPMPEPSLPINRTDFDNLIIMNEKFSWAENDAAIQKFINDFRHTDRSFAAVKFQGCGHLDQSDIASIIPSRIMRILSPKASIPTDHHKIIQATTDLLAALLSYSFPMFSFDSKWEISQLSDIDRRNSCPELNDITGQEQVSIDSMIKLETFINFK